MDIEIRRANPSDAEWLQDSFDRLMGWHKPQGYFAECCRLQEEGSIVLLVAEENGEYLGHVKVVWQSSYAYFRVLGIPEIQDLNVLPNHRRKGIGTLLVDAAEDQIREFSDVAGIGFGLYADYGAAQRMYVSRGYVPDGNGIAYNGANVEPGRTVVVDDDLVLYLTKTLA
jgi:GNAT superfamily N-acetyltransferase